MVSEAPRLKIFMLQISYMKESHGDWLGVEHNSALANELKAKYGELMRE